MWGKKSCAVQSHIYTLKSWVRSTVPAPLDTLTPPWLPTPRVYNLRMTVDIVFELGGGAEPQLGNRYHESPPVSVSYFGKRRGLSGIPGSDSDDMPRTGFLLCHDKDKLDSLNLPSLSKYNHYRTRLPLACIWELGPLHVN